MHIQMIESGIFRNRDQTVYAYCGNKAGNSIFSFGFARVSEVRHMWFVLCLSEFLPDRLVPAAMIKHPLHVTDDLNSSMF